MSERIEPISLSDVVQVLGASVRGEANWTAWSISTDTRTVSAPNSLFFALRGENFDGHNYVLEAERKGAAAIVVDREIPRIETPQLIVPNTLEALGRLARFYREQFEIPVVGVTGSVGKTSTKEMIALALRVRLKTHANKASFNNEVGLPLTLFGLDRSHKAAVLEMGMRGFGQIEDLCRIARPTIGVVTNVGMSHIELLGSRDGIAQAKSELLTSLDTGGVAVINADNEYYDFLASVCSGRIVSYGLNQAADFRVTDIKYIDNKDTCFKINGVYIQLHATGEHHAINAAAACAVASILDLSLTEVAEHLGHFRPFQSRGTSFRTSDNITVLDDTYNAAPDSFRSALQTLTVLSGGTRRTVAVLGDMKELGLFSSEAHRYVGQIVKQRDVQLLITVGQDAREIADEATHLPSLQKYHFVDAEAAYCQIRDLVKPDDIVLIKGSRAMKMEKIIEAFAPKT